MDGNEDMGMNIQIIVPVYNVEVYLEEFFRCLERQTIQNFKIIMIDDASTDNSINIIEREKRVFKDRLIIMKNDHNIGLSKTRNIGLKVAANSPTKYITFLDPDDLFDDEYIEDLYNNAEKNKTDLTIAGIQRFDDITKRVICTEMVKYCEQPILDSAKCVEMAYINPCVYAKLYRFEKIQTIHFRDIKRSEDTCYLFDCLPYLKTIKFTNNAYYHYRVRSSALSGTVNDEKVRSMHQHFGEMMQQFQTDKYLGYKEMFETQVFIRSSVGGVCRHSFGNIKNRRKFCSEELRFLDSKLPDWRRNQYLSFRYSKNRGLKQDALRACAVMYKIHLFPLFIRFYYFMSQILKKDVRA